MWKSHSAGGGEVPLEALRILWRDRRQAAHIQVVFQVGQLDPPRDRVAGRTLGELLVRLVLASCAQSR
jgi:hypothetical protein